MPSFEEEESMFEVKMEASSARQIYIAEKK